MIGKVLVHVYWGRPEKTPPPPLKNNIKKIEQFRELIEIFVKKKQKKLGHP
jgi:hypothetical protein